MSARATQRNNVLAGFFLVLGLVVAVVLSFWTSDIFDRVGTFRSYTIDFSLRDGATGLEKGSPVLLGGKSVGRVEAVDWRREGGTPDGRTLAVAIEVRVKVRTDLPIYENAQAWIERPILGGLAAINIIDPGDPAEGASLVAEGGRIGGRLAPSLLAQAGFGPEQVEEMKSILREVNAAATDIATITGAIAPNAESNVADVDAMLKAARRLVEQTETDYRSLWSPKVTAMLDQGAEITDVAKAIVDSVLLGVEDARAGIDEARGVIRTTQQILDDSAGDVDAILANVEQATRHFNEVTMLEVDQAISRGSAAVDEFGQLGDSLNLLVQEQRPQIQATMTNVRLASLDARLFLDEVKAQPWRLLRQPNTKELERELLYSSARAYANAVSDLRAASDSLDSILRQTSQDETPMLSPETITGLQLRIRDAFQTYQNAESSLLDAILKHAPAP
jgi:ABC-type transporter Mla subunit MlaD